MPWPSIANSTTMRQLDISYPTIEFTKLVKSWDGYQADKMGIILRHVKAKDLPFFVKPASTKKANGSGTKLAKGKSLKRAKSEKVRYCRMFRNDIDLWTMFKIRPELTTDKLDFV